jgi:hypothetical protein
MLHHHSQADYKTTVSEAARLARTMMEKKIETGRASAGALLEHVNTCMPTDVVARGSAMQFTMGEKGLSLGLKSVNEDPYSIHGHALSQLAATAHIPLAYLRSNLDSTSTARKDLAIRILNDHYAKPGFYVAKEDEKDLSRSRFLVRSVHGQTRAVLSDRYRRLDSRPLVEAFAESCQALGAVPVEGVVTDTRVALKAFLPMVFEPVEGEVMCLGVEWSNSDFGAGKHGLRAFIYRLWCSNGACMEDMLSQVHFGGRLADDIEFSDRTFRLDTQAQVSALKDIVYAALAPKGVNTLLATIKSADEQEIEWRKISTVLGKKLLKDEMKLVRDAFESDDVINLPAKKSIWRASNAVSWIAGKVEDQDRRLELQRFAGQVIHGKNEQADEVAA